MVHCCELGSTGTSEGFIRITRDKTIKNPVKEPLDIYKVIEEIACTVDLDKPIRQIGVRLSNTRSGINLHQLSFGEEKSFIRKKEIYKLTYDLKQRFGRKVILDPLDAKSQ